MASKHVRTNPTKIPANWAIPDDQVIDMGAYRVCGVVCARLKTQSGAYKVTVQHNPTKDPDRWINTTATFNLDGTGPDFLEVTSFTRYLRILSDATGPDGTAVLQIDWLGKE